MDFAPQAFSDDGTLDDAKSLYEWTQLIREASIKFGKQINITSLYKQWMIDAGYKDVTERVYKVLCALFYLP